MRLVSRYINAIAVGDGGYITPFVVGIFCDEIAVFIGDTYNVILCISDVIILLTVIAERADTAVCIGIEVDGVVFVSEKYQRATVVVIELCRNTVDGLGYSLSRRIVAVGDMPSNTML